jgi:hypothetical protein
MGHSSPPQLRCSIALANIQSIESRDSLIYRELP